MNTPITHEDFVQDNIGELGMLFYGDAFSEKEGGAFEDLYYSDRDFRDYCTQAWAEACDVYQSDCEARENFYYN